MILLFLLLSLNIYSQELYIGTSIGTKEQVFGRVTYEISQDYFYQEYSILFDSYGQFYAHMKMGFGITKKKWRAFIYLPYMNFSFKQISYNTPFGAEFFWNKSKFYPKWLPWMSINFDIYEDNVIPSIRLKYRIIR